MRNHSFVALLLCMCACPADDAPSATTGSDPSAGSETTQGSDSDPSESGTSTAATGSSEDTGSTTDAPPLPPPTPVHTVILTAGPNWDPDLPPEEQDLGDHFAYIQGLFDAGGALAYGPFLDDGRGFYLHLGETTEDIDAVIANDPAIKGGVLELHEQGSWGVILEALGADIGDDALFVLEYTPGPQWQDGVPLLEQEVGPHLDYVGGLFADGQLLAGGPVGDTQGRYIVAAPDMAGATALVDADPTVQSELFGVEIKPWSPFARQSITSALGD